MIGNFILGGEAHGLRGRKGTARGRLREGGPSRTECKAGNLRS